MTRLWVAIPIILACLQPAKAEIPDLCPNLSIDAPETTLVVGTQFSPPFIQGDKGKPNGLSVDFWNYIATCLNIPSNSFEFKEFGAEKDLLVSVKSGNVDVAIAPLALNATDEAALDFSFPYLESEIAALVADRTSGANFKRLIDRIFQSQILYIVLGLLAFMTLVACYYWWVERKRGNTFFSGGPLSGFYNSMIWAALLVFQGRGDPFQLASRGGQLIVLALIFVGVTIISSFTAIITSSLTLQGLEPEISTIDDLKTKIVEVMEDERASEWAALKGVDIRSTRSIPNAHWDLISGEVDVFLHDKEVLQFYVKEGAMTDVKFSPLTVAPVSYALALPQRSELREPINRAILNILESTAWESTKAKYLEK